MINHSFEVGETDDGTAVDANELLKTIRCLDLTLKSHLTVFTASNKQTKSNDRISKAVDVKLSHGTAENKAMKPLERVS